MLSVQRNGITGPRCLIVFAKITV